MLSVTVAWEIFSRFPNRIRHGTMPVMDKGNENNYYEARVRIQSHRTK